MKRTRLLQSGILLLAMMLAGSLQAGEKIRIEKLDDLPRYTYKIGMPAVEFLHNDSAVLELAAQVRKDLESDLATYEIADKTTLKNYYADLGAIALLEGRYADYLGSVEQRMLLEDKEANRLTMALYSRAYAAVMLADAKDFETDLRHELESRLVSLPYEIVGDVLKQSKGISEIYSAALVEGQVMAGIQPVLDGSDGEMSKDIATSLLSMSVTLRTYLPYKHLVTETYGGYLDAHKVEKADIWAERDFSVTSDLEATPVVIGIWDSGVDAAIFYQTAQVWINKGELRDNGVDDDGNGFIDDVHGIAYDLSSEKTIDLLYPIGDVGEERPRLQRQMKGLSDITSGIDSEEATELKHAMGMLERDEVQPFIEGISKYGNYAHGTHVAGIAAAGNDYARILGARITFDYTMIPTLPTIELAQAEARMYSEVIGYFQKNNVRVVNMSWGGSIAGIESALEANNAGGTVEERKALAREIFTIGRDALYHAIASVPEILFVTSAGNEDNDVNFEEFIPSSFDLPNILSVGAVDQAGDETDFTSFGKVDIYANGFEVDSYVPGGDRMKMSGTSMSSPNVTNLAAKLLAIEPSLTPSELRELMIEASELRMAGDRETRLIHPVKTLELLQSRKG